MRRGELTNGGQSGDFSAGIAEFQWTRWPRKPIAVHLPFSLLFSRFFLLSILKSRKGGLLAHIRHVVAARIGPPQNEFAALTVRSQIEKVHGETIYRHIVASGPTTFTDGLSSIISTSHNLSRTIIPGVASRSKADYRKAAVDNSTDIISRVTSYSVGTLLHTSTPLMRSHHRITNQTRALAYANA